MYLPDSLYERAPHYWLFIGLLLVVLGVTYGHLMKEIEFVGNDAIPAKRLSAQIGTSESFGIFSKGLLDPEGLIDDAASLVVGGSTFYADADGDGLCNDGDTDDDNDNVPTSQESIADAGTDSTLITDALNLFFFKHPQQLYLGR